MMDFSQGDVVKISGFRKRTDSYRYRRKRGDKGNGYL